MPQIIWTNMPAAMIFCRCNQELGAALQTETLSDPLHLSYEWVLSLQEV